MMLLLSCKVLTFKRIMYKLLNKLKVALDKQQTGYARRDYSLRFISRQNNSNSPTKESE